jgi:hypothetical protein
MRSKPHLRLLGLYVLIILLLTSSQAVYGASTPPGVKIFVAAPPRDLRLSINFNHPSLPEPKEMTKSTRGWETYFDYYYSKMKGRYDEDFHAAVLVVQSEKYNFEVRIPRDPQMRMYKRYMTLNLKAETLTFGEPVWRKPLYVIAHLLIALALKGIVIYLLGLRYKNTWIIFLIINLISQTWLSVYLADAFFGSYPLFFFYLAIAIFTLGEAFVVWITVDEIRRGTTAFLYVFLINIVSIFVGNLLLPHFPH